MATFKDSELTSQLSELKRKEEEALMQALSQKYGTTYINLHGVTINTDALRMITESAAKEAELVIFEKAGNKLSIAVRNPNKSEAKVIIEQLSARNFIPTVFLASTASLEYAWNRYHDINKTTASERGVLEISKERIEEITTTTKTIEDVANAIGAVSKSARAHQISEVLEVILGSAIALKASDVHIEPEERAVRLRFRLDGVLLDILDITADLYGLIRSRLKLLSGLKLNKNDEAQDGRFTINLGDGELDIRSSVIPGAFGESIVMRLLDPHAASRTIDELGINPILRKIIEAEIKRPTGAIITTGPTGSGKTTALYALLRYIHTPEVKIITLEDPIEYKIEGIVQSQVSEDYSFEAGLRAILRQDPDIILVGEIRDRDVAETAMHAALTGHLVFSTLHTNSAAGAFPRLIDLGVDGKMISSAVNLILGQRLVRVLCPVCKKKRAATPEEDALIRKTLVHPPEGMTIPQPIEMFEPVGCDKCNGTGFKGRVGVFEGIKIDSAVSDTIIMDPREDIIKKAALPQGIPTMQEDGILKVLEGTTSFDELARVVDLYDQSN